MNSTAQRKAPRPCGKGVGAEVCTVERMGWQFGEYPPCCRRNAEGYQHRCGCFEDSLVGLSFF